MALILGLLLTTTACTLSAPEQKTNKNETGYSNQKMGYSISYPKGTILTKTTRDDPNDTLLPNGQKFSGSEAFSKFGEGLCIKLEYKEGKIYLTSGVNHDNKYILCQSYPDNVGTDGEVRNSSEEITISGLKYTLDTMEILSAENSKDSFIYGTVILKNNMKITFSSPNDEELIKALKNIIESYSSSSGLL